MLMHWRIVSLLIDICKATIWNIPIMLFLGILRIRRYNCFMRNEGVFLEFFLSEISTTLKYHTRFFIFPSIWFIIIIAQTYFLKFKYMQLRHWCIRYSTPVWLAWHNLYKRLFEAWLLPLYQYQTIFCHFNFF